MSGHSFRLQPSSVAWSLRACSLLNAHVLGGQGGSHKCSSASLSFSSFPTSFLISLSFYSLPPDRLFAPRKFPPLVRELHFWAPASCLLPTSKCSSASVFFSSLLLQFVCLHLLFSPAACQFLDYPQYSFFPLLWIPSISKTTYTEITYWAEPRWTMFLVSQSKRRTSSACLKRFHKVGPFIPMLYHWHRSQATTLRRPPLPQQHARLYTARMQP